MILKSTDNFGKRRQFLWKIIRCFVPAKTRWFFEGHPKMRGQLWFKERKLIHNTVKAYKPLHCFEIGTWKGGGTTLFITQALYENGQGKLHTIEINENFYNEARKNYEIFLPYLVPHIEFHFGDYQEIYSKVLFSLDGIDFLFLDGPEDAQLTLSQFNFFSPYMKKGGILMVHDWFTEKARLVKTQILESEVWEVITILSPPISLGLAQAVKK